MLEPKCHVCAHHVPKAKAMQLRLQLQAYDILCEHSTQHTARCYLLLGLVTKYLMSCCCCIHDLSGPSCADLSVHDLHLSRCCFALSCLLLFWFGTFKALWLLCRLMPVAQELFGFRASFLLLILGAAGAWCIHGQLHLLCYVLHKAPLPSYIGPDHTMYCTPVKWPAAFAVLIHPCSPQSQLEVVSNADSD